MIKKKFSPLSKFNLGFYLNLFVGVYFHCLATYLRRNIFLPCLFYLFIIIICNDAGPAYSHLLEQLLHPLQLSQCIANQPNCIDGPECPVAKAEWLFHSNCIVKVRQLQFLLINFKTDIFSSIFFLIYFFGRHTHLIK